MNAIIVRLTADQVVAALRGKTIHVEGGIPDDARCYDGRPVTLLIESPSLPAVGPGKTIPIRAAKVGHTFG